MLKVALLLGGPSPERAISLNSARSVADHFDRQEVMLAEIVYFDRSERPYSISRSLLYSNNPGDFDFKLSQTATALTDASLADRLRRCDLAFVVMHGRFGEDGGVQQLLEDLGVAYVGSSAGACRIAYDKFLAYTHLTGHGLATVRSSLLTRDRRFDEAATAELGSLLEESGAVVLKPAAGGSSLDVQVADSLERALASVSDLFGRHDRVVAQPWVRGIEFTAIVLEGPGGPVALPPVEIELRNRSARHDIFSFRRKYLPTDDTRYHCPPRFAPDVVDGMRSQAEAAFRALGMRDFARIDGWLLPDGRILLSDVNPISGMEQNSFLFIEASEIGMTHHDALRFILDAACRRCQRPATAAGTAGGAELRGRRVPVPVLFGGSTAERQVSVLSGTNVWLKLQASSRYQPYPCLLDTDGNVWLLSYPAALRHTVEEISSVCQQAHAGEPLRQRIAADVVARLGLRDCDLDAATVPPERLKLSEFLDGCSMVFNALHGGDGEDGTLQAELDRRGIRYNGCGAGASALCMDKFDAGEAVRSIGDPAIRIPRRVKVRLPVPLDGWSVEALWAEVQARCQSPGLVAKPVADGCSAGVVPLESADELRTYLRYLDGGSGRIPAGSFDRLGRDQVVELPTGHLRELLLEEYVETDDIAVVDGDDVDGEQNGHEAARLEWGATRDTGWVEVTVGVVGHRGCLRALSPSMTIARRGVLSVEEKFMGGTGVNITPPPSPPWGRVRPRAVQQAKRHVVRIAEALGVEGYARIDAFIHRDLGDVIFIEANTLPALTPSTVLYHQALAEDPPLFPLSFLERLLDLGLDGG